MKKLSILFIALAAVALGMVSCGDEPINQIVVNPNSTNGMMPGKFTVDVDGTQVRFSQGNLQYNAVSDAWKFATHQWDTIGAANANIASDYNGWIDLFGWGTGKNPTENSRDDNVYTEPFKDWGLNPIANGNNPKSDWRTLTNTEWRYILCDRTDAQKLFGLGSVNGINGLILLPDEWTKPADVPVFRTSAAKGLTWNVGKNCYYNSATDANNFDDNIYDTRTWEAMEVSGAIFLPVAGYRDAPRIRSVSSYGGYWTSIATSDHVSPIAYSMEIKANSLTPYYTVHRYYGLSVRLVQNVE